MRKLGEQWVETIDGKEHMVKAVKGVCENCFISHLCNISADCPTKWGCIGKDLGILKDGLLPSSWGEYPTIQYPSEEGEVFCIYAFLVVNNTIVKDEKAWGETLQQAIDAWNARL